MDDAERQLVTALQADPGNASALNTLGNVYLDRAEVSIDANDAPTGEGLLERARSSYERSLNASAPGTGDSRRKRSPEQTWGRRWLNTAISRCRTSALIWLRSSTEG